MRIDTAEQVLLDIVGNELFHAQHRIPAGTDWQAVYKESRKQTVSLIALKGAKKAAVIPAEVMKAWEGTAVADAYNNIRVSQEHLWLDGVMKKAGIPYVILKGCSSAAYYPEPGERCMGDVDFLVRPEDVERTGRLLEAEGYTPSGQGHHCHIVYEKELTHLELHYEINGIPEGRAGEVVQGYLEDIIERAEEVAYEDGTINCPAPFHHGLILLIHTAHHILGGGVGLRHLCDWAVFAESFPEDEFCERFEKPLKEIGLWKFTCILTAIAEKGLGCPHRKYVDQEDEEAAEALLGDIFKGGNFGRKEETRNYESMLIGVRGKEGTEKASMPRQLVRSVNKIVRTNWPAAKKYPILLLPGWVFFGGRYVLRVCRGRRPSVNPAKLVKNASERKDVYSRLKLYEKSN